ncbi:Transcriptional regulator, TetR family [Asaia bogorensis]|uniref:Transcriptional regulator, TetR family n=1 Tax=Asaia bogorensis TaxID=91915 RepID=A0A060QCX2_9PROT|nr:TetR family transcriptional regulator [Asaia sp. SF2.1]CDG38999.1 Transcriptional regulator, TetR family [Asaia bogorensis]
MTPKKSEGPCRPRGRPPAFDRATALSKAVKLFWDRGYEGTSFDDLITAMGISASSFYNSFASKEALYVEAIEAYAEKQGAWFVEALSTRGTSFQAFAAMFDAAATAFTREDAPAGCMIAVAATQCSPAQLRLRDLMINQRHLAEQAIHARLEQGVEEGDLPHSIDPDAMAACYGAVLGGMGIQARDGASREKLRLVGRMALNMLPNGAT